MEELTELEKFGVGVAINFRIDYLEKMLDKSLQYNDEEANPLSGLNDDLRAIYKTRVTVLRAAAVKLGITL